MANYLKKHIPYLKKNKKGISKKGVSQKQWQNYIITVG